MNLQDSSFFLVRNIPGSFHSYHLRAFFSYFTENNGFTCFHFRHRPEHQLAHKSNPESTTKEKVLTSVSDQEGQKGETNDQVDSTVYGQHGGLQEQIRGTDGKNTAAIVNRTGDERKEEEDTRNLVIGRDERQVDSTMSHASQKLPVRAGTLCCVVAVRNEFRSEFISSYNKQHWTDANGDMLPLKVKIIHLNFNKQGNRDDISQSCDAHLNFSDILTLPELNPPKLMPQGNVGTPVAVFMQLIRTCRLPSHVIRKLKLEFPSGKRRSKYSAVPMDYMSSRKGVKLSEMELGTGVDEKEEEEEMSIGPKRKKIKGGSPTTEEEEEDTKETKSDDELDAEEWERYEALHEDVDKQERSGDRLFEEEMEVVWDKGSSGLVFYTDANYWDEMEGDFDEKCSKEDDWDVDTGVYYGYASVDKTSQDMRDMELERRLREGEDVGSWKGRKGFIEHTKGIGSKLMKKKGWKEGLGLGRDSTGISQPLEAQGQHPNCKKGLGYRGEKLSMKITAQPKRTREVLISTIYDKPDEVKDTVLRRGPPTTMKYREKGQLPNQKSS